MIFLHWYSISCHHLRRYQIISNKDISSFEETLLVKSQDSNEKASLKLISSDTPTVPLLKQMKQHELRKVFKYYLLSESKNYYGKVTMRTYLGRQYYFNVFHFDRKYPVPKHARSRKVTVELVDINGALRLNTLCDCGCVQ